MLQYCRRVSLDSKSKCKVNVRQESIVFTQKYSCQVLRFHTGSFRGTNPASIFPIPTVPSISTSPPQSHKRSTHPLLLSCCHGNHHCVANGESQEEVQVRICVVAASAAFCPANLLKQLPVWNHLGFLLELKHSHLHAAFTAF